MPIREEIYKVLVEQHGDGYYEDAINEIIKLFEKLIDEKINAYKRISYNDNIIKITELVKLKEELSKR